MRQNCTWQTPVDRPPPPVGRPLLSMQISLVDRTPSRQINPVGNPRPHPPWTNRQPEDKQKIHCFTVSKDAKMRDICKKIVVIIRQRSASYVCLCLFVCPQNRDIPFKIFNFFMSKKWKTDLSKAIKYL